MVGPENLDRFRRMLVYRGAGLGRFHCTSNNSTPVLPAATPVLLQAYTGRSTGLAARLSHAGVYTYI